MITTEFYITIDIIWCLFIYLFV